MNNLLCFYINGIYITSKEKLITYYGEEWFRLYGVGAVKKSTESQNAVRDVLEEHRGSYVMFISVRREYRPLREILETFKLKKHVIYSTKFIKNHNYMDMAPRLKLTIVKIPETGEFE